MADEKELLKRINLDLLYPPFRTKMIVLARNLEANGTRFYATSGMRTVEEQNALWQKGRGPDGKILDPKGKGIVTKVKGGFSYHNYGIAVDWCRDGDLDKPGLQPDYDRTEYEPLAGQAEYLGIESGLRWKGFIDAPHVQLPIKAVGLEIKDLYVLYKQGGIAAVWDFLDQWDW